MYGDSACETACVWLVHRGDDERLNLISEDELCGATSRPIPHCTTTTANCTHRKIYSEKMGHWGVGIYGGVGGESRAVLGLAGRRGGGESRAVAKGRARARPKENDRLLSDNPGAGIRAPRAFVEPPARFV